MFLLPKYIKRTGDACFYETDFNIVIIIEVDVGIDLYNFFVEIWVFFAKKIIKFL